MSKRILTNERDSYIDDIFATDNFRVYCYKYNEAVPTLYAVIIADDNTFEGL